MERWEYAGRWALVTGASAGIGEAFARELARRGMHVAVSARREDRLRALEDELARAYHVQTVVVPADLAQPGAPSALWASASDDGRRIDLLINNAGFGLRGRFDELSADRQAEMVRLNCMAPMELMHAALREMRSRRSGAVVNVASIAGYQPIPYMAAYAASKAFVLALSEAVAEESRDDGVRIVAVSPGPVATEFQQVAGTSVSEKTLGIRTPQQVVDAALLALERGTASVVPGLINGIAAAAVRVAPRSLVLRAAKKVMKSFR
ncbi:MAG TPA: SDR family oxidoreductase [Longimicrobiaceae bacterium]|jgi:short-subunit dehydrogenase|nr:SDR family oxidoreductase [Longimicrobiaceae bacterium]